MTPAYTQLFTDLSAICRRPELSRQQMLNHSLALICQHTQASRAAILAPAAETLPTTVVASTPRDWSLTKPVEFETYPWLMTDGPAGQPVLGYFNLSDPAGVRWGVLGVEADRQDFF
jgi:hypothetical protein